MVTIASEGGHIQDTHTLSVRVLDLRQYLLLSTISHAREPFPSIPTSRGEHQKYLKLPPNTGYFYLFMGLKETWYVSFPPFTLVVLRGGAAFAHMIVPHFGATSVGQAMLQGAWSLVDWWELMAPKFHP